MFGFGLDGLLAVAGGLVAGAIWGLIYGQWKSTGALKTALETALTTAGGTALGWLLLGPIGASMAGLNGLVSGARGIYNWRRIAGAFAFLSDSTWSLIGTTLGNLVHLINLFLGPVYRADLSRRKNRNLYEKGFALKGAFAFTQGNVISNAALGDPTVNESFIKNHEELHVWQSRFFGPLFQGGYILWAFGAFIVAFVYWLANRTKKFGSLLETAAYYDNPFEFWAYKNDKYWPPAGADPALRW